MATDPIDLLKRVRKGDRTARSRLLGQLRPHVLRYVTNRVRSHASTRAVAEELTQVVLLRITRSLEDCRARTHGQLWGWVRTIADRLVIDRHRRRKHEREARAWTSRPDHSPAAEEGDGPASVVGPENESETVERIIGRLLYRAQDALSSGTRTVVRRRLLRGETWTQVAEAVGTTAGGAKRRWQRALPRLRDEVLSGVRDLPPPWRTRVLQRLGVEGWEDGQDSHSP